MKALLIANGRVKDIQFYKDEIINKSDYDMIICADGGVNNALKLDLLPDVVIGDLDSISQRSIDIIKRNNIKVIEYSKYKDETDTELVLEYIIQYGYKFVTMIGCIGDRIDHSLANIYLLNKLLKHNIIGNIIDEKNDIYLIDNSIDISDKKDSIISLLPLSDTVEGITSTGLYYTLEESFMVKEVPYGISNKLTSNNAQVKVTKGELLVIISKD
ncbi:thiamine diphosphokinase [Alkalibaculum sp. M08DMB]|uniref:Thiamine diphosphokinase n=1 Tax=Alkalibaculum sporogenes TaxID=2655001 RepID=A0A6A7K985_9FIRM|nr:thiamine diphosphokinase [Alkalibaculum sporogenes]MPW26038.1 thiamine diphosphokinase [Alkalibaculum sporogenes]